MYHTCVEMQSRVFKIIKFSCTFAGSTAVTTPSTQLPQQDHKTRQICQAHGTLSPALLETYQDRTGGKGNHRDVCFEKWTQFLSLHLFFLFFRMAVDKLGPQGFVWCTVPTP